MVTGYSTLSPLLGPIEEKAWAKLNLFLHITGQRQDGYHDLESLFVFTEFHDRVVVQLDPKISSVQLAVEGDFADNVPPGNDNSVVQAVAAMLDAQGWRGGARVTLTKNIPVAAGLGGGSADAAAVLRALARAFHAPTHDARIMQLAASLGSDVTPCLASTRCYVRGRGDQTIDYHGDFPSCFVVLVNPYMPLATRDVFARYAFHCPRLDSVIPLEETSDFDRLCSILRQTHNALVPPALALCPAVGEVLAALQERTDDAFVGMSGSGATCFALVRSQHSARQLAQSIQASRPWWVCATPLREA